VIDQSIELQKLIEQSVKAIAVGAHNTERVNFENVEFVIDYVCEAAAREGLDLVPANCPMVREAACPPDQTKKEDPNGR
jgi:methylase of polypeptide subunit release factors